MARKAHVKRVYKETRNADGTVTRDESVWVDMLRIDGTTFRFKTVPDGSAFRKANYRFNWNDSKEENKAPFRLTEKRTVKNANDSGQTIDVWIVDKTRMTHKGGLQPGDGTGGNQQFIQWRFNNPPQGGTRQTTAVRVINNDLGGLDMSKGPVSWETYSAALKKGNKDETQAIDVQVVDSFLIRFGADAVLPQTSIKNKMRYGLANQAIEGMFKKSPGDAKPTRFDPLQVPINCGFQQSVVAVYGGPNTNGNTLALFRLRTNKDTGKQEVYIAWERKPFDGSIPAGDGLGGQVSIPFTVIEEANVDEIDDQGNIRVTSRFWDPPSPDVFYDIKGNKIAKMPTLKPKPAPKPPQRMLNSINNVTFDSSYSIVPDPNDGRSASFFDNYNRFVDSGAHNSFITLRVVGAVDNTGLSFPPDAIPHRGDGTPLPAVLQTGKGVYTHKVTLIKYDIDGRELWRRDYDNTRNERTSGVRVMLNSVKIGEGKPPEYGQVPWYANYYNRSGGSDSYEYISSISGSGKRYAGAACLGDFVIVIFVGNEGTYPAQYSFVDNWEDIGPDDPHGTTVVTFNGGYEDNYIIEILDNSGAVVNTILWGSEVFAASGDTPISYGSQPGPYHDPYPTDLNKGGTATLSYANGYATLMGKTF